MYNRIPNSQRQLNVLHCDIIDEALRFNVPFTDEDKRILRSRGESEGSSFFKVTLPILGRALDTGLVTGYFECPVAFSRKGNLPHFAFEVFNEIFDVDGKLNFSANPTYIQFLRQLLLFESKMWEYPTPAASRTAWESFKTRQARLRLFRVPQDFDPLVKARKLMTKMLSHLSLNDITPGHGPGSVAECLNSEDRWDFTYWPLRAGKYYPYCRYGIPNELYYDPKDRPATVTGLSTRVVLVPKDFRGPRLISVEPVVHQYLQQGQMKKIYDYVDSHPILSRSIRFRDQTLNQKRAKTAWELGEFTLDLSDASDNVSATLVWYLLSDLPGLRSRLFATRSSYATYRGERIRLSAFSPMGSAVCFPIETLVFWAISVACLSISLPKEPLDYLAGVVSVFGDDIVAPDCCYSLLLGTLETLGMTPNRRKTCRETPFRESCGTEWYNGVSVSIVRNSSVQYGELGLNDVPDMINLQRNLFLAGLYHAAMSMTDLVLGLKPIPITLDLSDEFPDFLLGIPVNGKVRWNKDLQRSEAWTVYFCRRSDQWNRSSKGGLLARLLGDLNDRVPRRDVIVKTGWRRCPTA